MKFQGLSPQEVEASRKQHGSNALTQLPPDPLWKKLLEGFKDPMIMILLAALVIQVILFCLGQAEWFEPVGILVAILIANGVAAVSESKQEGKASALKEEEEAKEMVKVIRSGALCEIHVSDVVVGDLVYLQAGDKLPADGTVVEGTLFVDQAALNGETEEAEKIPLEEGATYDIKDLLNKYYAYRGTVVCGGEGFLAVKVVGDKTLFGELALEVQEDTRETPLQVKLGKLAKQISTFGYVGAIAIVAGILLKTLLTGAMPSGIYAWIRLVMDAITVAVTIIVCAVPEGLPMLTSILLSEPAHGQGQRPGAQYLRPGNGGEPQHPLQRQDRHHHRGQALCGGDVHRQFGCVHGPTVHRPSPGRRCCHRHRGEQQRRGVQ